MENCPEYQTPPDLPPPATQEASPEPPPSDLLQVGDRVIGIGPGKPGQAKNAIVTITHVTPARAYGGRYSMGAYQFTFIRGVGLDGRVHTLSKDCGTPTVWRKASRGAVLDFYRAKYASECVGLMKLLDLSKLPWDEVEAVWQVLGKYVPVREHPDTCAWREYLAAHPE